MFRGLFSFLPLYRFIGYITTGTAAGISFHRIIIGGTILCGGICVACTGGSFQFRPATGRCPAVHIVPAGPRYFPPADFYPGAGLTKRHTGLSQTFDGFIGYVAAIGRTGVRFYRVIIRGTRFGRCIRITGAGGGF